MGLFRKSKSQPVTADETLTSGDSIIIKGDAPGKLSYFKDDLLNLTREYLQTAADMKIPLPKKLQNLVVTGKRDQHQINQITTSGQEFIKPLPPRPTYTPSIPTENIPLSGYTSLNVSPQVKSPEPITKPPVAPPPPPVYAPPPPVSVPETTGSNQSSLNKSNYIPSTFVNYKPYLKPPPEKPEAEIATDFPEYGRIVSTEVLTEGSLPAKIIAPLFFLMTFSYTTLSLLFIGTILALSIALSNAGSPGFYFLKYYPKLGLLPVMSSLASLTFLYVSFKIRDSSRASWFLAILTLAIIPLSLSFILPVMSYPLVKLVAVYAGTPEKPLVSPSINLTTLSNFFSVFLLFESMLFLLIATIKSFNKKMRPLGSNAKSAIAIMLLLIIFPVSGIVAYGYFDAYTSDYGYADVYDQVDYPIYIPEFPENNRLLSSKFIDNEILADNYNAIKTTYDIPLPSVIESGHTSPITIIQSQVAADFDLPGFLFTQNRDNNQVIKAVDLKSAFGNTGYIIEKRTQTELWLIMPESVLVELSTATATSDELISIAELLSKGPDLKPATTILEVYLPYLRGKTN